MKRAVPAGPGRRSRWPLAFAGVIYALAAFLANRGVWVHGVTHTIQTSGGSDVQEEVWFLAQTPWALIHGVNPLANSYLNAPVGLNLMDNTSMILLGVLGAPITLLFGPIATFNVLFDLGFWSSALAFFVTARRWTGWWPAAFAGGLLYGFSPYAVAVGTGHLFLLYTAVLPLIVLTLDRFLRHRAGARVTGVALGLCLTAQLYISAEVLASLIVVMLAGAAVAGIVWRGVRAVGGRDLSRLAGTTLAVTVAGCGYAVWIGLAGPQHISGPAQSATALAGLSTDPLSLVVPTTNQLLTFGHGALGNRLVAQRDARWRVVAAAPEENGGYVGLPLLAALLVTSAVLRRRKLAVFCAAMAGITLLLSMGSRLHLDGRLTPVPLPFAVLAHLPLLDSGAAARYLVFFWLFAAGLVTLGLDAAYAALAGWGAGHQAAAPRLLGSVAPPTAAVLVLLPLLPAWPYSSGPARVPTWFTSGQQQVAAGTMVVVYPLTSPRDSSAMVWQAMSGFAFKMPGGYAVFRSPTGRATFAPQSSLVRSAFIMCAEGRAVSIPPAEIRDQLLMWHTSAIVVDGAFPGAACAEGMFDRVVGRPRHEDGVLVWTMTPRRAGPEPA